MHLTKEQNDKHQGGRITGREIQQLLQNRWRVQYKLSSVYVLLKRLNVVWITSRSQHLKADISANFSEKVKQASSQDIELKDVEIWFQDKHRIGQQGSLPLYELVEETVSVLFINNSSFRAQQTLYYFPLFLYSCLL